MAFRIYTGAQGKRFVGEDNLGPIVARISVRSGRPVNSHARDEAAKDQLHQIGLHTQAEVIELHRQGVPGYGPANPVNQTTHCRYNDGIAYRFWPRFMRIPWWARGIDVAPPVADFCAEARKEGFMVTPTYPGSAGEAQHVNFRNVPRVAPRPLKRGAKRSLRLWRLKKSLNELGYLSDEALKIPHFGELLDHAVRDFQRDHHLVVDGVVGPHTSYAIAVALRQKKKGKR